MYIELILKNITYRGELISNSNNTIIFRDIFTNSICNIELPLHYTLYEYNDLFLSYFNYKVEHIKRLSEESLFNEDDVILIANAYDVVKIYHILHTLRSLGFKFNTLDQLTLLQLKENIWLNVEREYSVNLDFIKNDDDLDMYESKNLILAINRAKDRYQTLLQTTDSIIEVLKAYPPMFNETLSYLSEIIRYIDQNESKPNFICTF